MRILLLFILISCRDTSPNGGSGGYKYEDEDEQEEEGSADEEQEILPNQLPLLKDPGNWSNWYSAKGFGPTDGLDLANSYCISWEYTGDYENASKQYDIYLELPNGDRGAEGSYLSACSDEFGEYKILAVLRDDYAANPSTIFTAQKDESYLLGHVTDPDSWTFKWGKNKCKGLDQKTIPHDTYCTTWALDFFTQHFTFVLEDKEGKEIDNGSYLYSCNYDIPGYRLYVVSNGSKERTLIHEVSRADEGQDVDIKCDVGEGSGSGGEVTNYSITYIYKVGQTYPDYYCQTDGLQSFREKEHVQSVPEATFNAMAANAKCAPDAVKENNLLCEYIENCTSSEAYCEKGYGTDLRFGYWTRKVCKTPDFK